MKIIVIVRTLNEQRNVVEFCQNYQWADRIFIADGGSTDKTIELASKFNWVEIRDFPGRHYLPNGLFMNPEPEHVNFLIEWAEAEGADWIVLDDCDDWPTRALYRDARALMYKTLSKTDYAAIYINRLYIWKETKYLPKINVGPSLWAWMPTRIKIRWPENDLTLFDAIGPQIDGSRVFNLDYPYAGLHYFTRDYSTKRKRYAAWGKPQLPLENGIYWPPEPLPEWAKDHVDAWKEIMKDYEGEVIRNQG